MPPYFTPFILSDPVGNNAFSYESRSQKTLFVPARRDGDFSDVRKGREIVFADTEDGILRECIGLDSFISTHWQGIPVTIFDNHNHALYFWYEALVRGYIEQGIELIHIDEHSDLWENIHQLTIDNGQLTTENLDSVFHFTNHSCNVGNYIQPALRNGLIKTMIRIEGEGDLLRYEYYQAGRNMILNLDLDFFSPDLDWIDSHLKKKVILHLAKQAKYITIATSPFFIDQDRAIEVMMDLFE